MESDLILTGEEQTLEDMFCDAMRMMPKDCQHILNQNEVFKTDAFDDVDVSNILGKVSVASEIGSSTTPVDHHRLPPYICRFSLTSSPGKKLRLKPV